MEEKEPIKIKLSTAILLFIILILIGGIVYFAIQNNKINELKDVSLNEVQTLQGKVEALENTINNSQNIEANNQVEQNNVTNTNTTTNTITSSKTDSAITTKVTDKYAEITEKLDLDDKEIFVVTDVEKNEGKYTLKGTIYTEYTLTKSEYNDAKKTGNIIINGKKYTVEKDEDSEGLSIYAKNDDSGYHIRESDDGTYVLSSYTQQGICYKATNNYKKIIVDENVKCVHTNYNGSSDEEEVLENTTVKNYFKDFKNITEENTKPSELLPDYNFEFKNGKCVKVTIHTIWI